MVSINTNLQSLIVQNNLSKSTTALNTAIERMTTGYKINHAKDNAANYSIAESYSSKLSSYQVAEDNASMGLDMMKTAMDSMDLISNHLSRIRDLAEQASNGTYGEDSLNAINEEIQARISEINRVVSNTDFNGINLLDGDAGGTTESNVTGYFLKQVNQLTEKQAIAQGYTVIKTKADLENIKNNMSGKYILMNDIDLEDSCLSYSTSSSYTFSGELNGNGYVIKNFRATSQYAAFFAEAENSIIKNLGLEVTDILGNIAAGLIGTSNGRNVIDNAYVVGHQSMGYALINEFTDFGSTDIIRDTYFGTGPAPFGPNARDLNSLENVYNVDYVYASGQVIDPSDQVSIQESGARNVQLQVGINGDLSSNIEVSFGGLGLSGLEINITSNDDARSALSTIDEYLSTISSKQTEYGAVYNRLESTIESIGVNIENLTSSRSTIKDADIAQVSSDYIRHQILQQAAATLLATANQSPAIALQLI